MASIRIPTPLRPYTNGQSEVAINGGTIGAALADLTAQHPALKPHLYTEGGELRAFVNIFLNDEDVRHLQGAATAIKDSDRLMIVPSIAGGNTSAPLQKVDHTALRVNQACIIGLSMVAFIFNAPWLAALVAVVMAYGTARQQPGFRALYSGFLKPRGWVQPDVIPDNPEPHVFAQGFGMVVLAIGAAALLAGVSTLGWGLVWLVVALAALNLFGGFCAGCAVYYWLNRLKAPGFAKAPPPGTFPGMRPKA
jgi:molybdopterin converting factor small subunit